MSHEELNRKIRELSLKLEYLHEHPVIMAIKKQLEDLTKTVEDLETAIDDLAEKIAEIEKRRGGENE